MAAKRGSNRSGTRSEAMADRRKSNAAWLKTVPRDRSIHNEAFPLRRNELATVNDATEYSTLPTNVKAMRDNLSQNSVGSGALDSRSGNKAVTRDTISYGAIGEDEIDANKVKNRHLAGVEGDRAVQQTNIGSGELVGRHYSTNSVGTTALSNLDGSRAVGSEHAQDGFLTNRHFPGIAPKLPASVGVEWGQLDNKPENFRPENHNNDRHTANYLTPGDFKTDGTLKDYLRV